jgi:hypothetical protein
MADCEGKVQWRRSGMGREPGRFWYPSGIELGRISGYGVPCLGVADSWNRRIQFLDPDGNFLTQWDRAGEQSFGEVTDIRFIDNSLLAGESSGGYWLVLDRGNHRLWGLSMDGKPLFRVGKEFPVQFEDRWQKHEIASVEDCLPAGYARDIGFFDPLYYPSRIFGRGEEGIFLLDSSARYLKQLLLGNLLPLWIEIPKSSQWISADPSGLLTWDATKSSIGFFDAEKRAWFDKRMEDTPVVSGRSSREVWTRRGDYLNLWKWPSGSAASVFPVLQRLAAEIEGRLNGVPLSDGILHLCENAKHCAEMSRLCLEGISEDSADAGAWSRLNSFLEAFRSERTVSVRDISTSVHTLFLAFLKLRLLQYLFPHAPDHEKYGQIRQLLENTTHPLAKAFVSIASCYENVVHFQVLDSAGRRVGASLEETQRILLKDLQDTLIEKMKVVALWSGLLPAAGSIYETSGSSDAPAKESVPNRFWLVPSSHPYGGRISRHLREVDRIHLGDPKVPGPATPVCLAHSGNGGILVSLFIGNRVLQLDSQFRIEAEIAAGMAGFDGFHGPFGILRDDDGSIWVTEPSLHRIRIYDASQKAVRNLDIHGNGSDPLCFPHGLCRGPNGTVLIADTGNHRILSCSKSGNISVLSGRIGRNRGEFRYPAFLSGAVSPENSIWVVDQYNHRLQQLDGCGRSIHWVGGCGLERGSFVFPEAVVQYSDGTLVVDQSLSNRALILLAPDGCEIDRMSLDYCARGMLIHQDRLLIAGSDDSSIRVYERM